MEMLEFLWKCFQAYRVSKRPPCDSTTYFAIHRNGVPRLTVMIGRGRDAWVVSTFAAEHRLMRPPPD